MPLSYLEVGKANRMVDLLANGDRISCHFAFSRSNANKARECYFAILWYRPGHYRSDIRKRDPWQRCRRGIGYQETMAKYGTYRLGRPQEIHGHIP